MITFKNQQNFSTKLQYLFTNPGFLKNSPITKQKGLKGKARNTKSLVNQKRGRGLLWSKTLTSVRFYQKTPTVLYTVKTDSLTKSMYFFFKSGNGLVFLLKNININLFCFYFYNFKTILPRFKTVLSSYQLLFIKVGIKVTKIRDLFKPSVVFATAYRSEARVMFFDRWAGFFTIKLPSGLLRFFFYLSRFEPSPWNFKNLFMPENQTKSFKLSLTRAGTYKKLGRKSKVRGVAKNPVDHPHGGRTKSIRFQRTPWGLPTKLK